jgi:hypothetical protein
VQLVQLHPARLVTVDDHRVLEPDHVLGHQLQEPVPHRLDVGQPRDKPSTND